MSKYILFLLCLTLTGAGNAKYGHLTYKQAEEKNLIVAGQYPDGRKRYLLKNAHAAFKKMRQDAKKDGIVLTLISAFRTVKYQQYLFNRAVKRYGSKKEAARHVAPSGCSEHHTGTAVDIGDGKNPTTNLRISFEHTKTYSWLKKNAKNYGFTMSFPKDNPQGVSYEPWHWKFKGRSKRGKGPGSKENKKKT